MKFKELLTNKETLKVLEEVGYDTPTEIQQKVIPIIKSKKDVLGQSQTGTGKTLAFAGPILDEIKENKKTQAIILAPTRELALQITKDIEVYSKYTKINITTVYGSSSIEEQIRKLKNGSEIVVGTPGRIMDLLKRKKLNIAHLQFFVLDEADEMLSMGFQEDLEYIFESTNKDKQVLLFSATMPEKIVSLASKYMKKGYETIKAKQTTMTAANIKQDYYVVSNNVRIEALSRILDYYDSKRTIIFVRTKRNADELLAKLLKKGYNANVIHGDITQDQRIKTLDSFKSGVFNYLIATDVAARGIHIDDVEIVINYNLPESHESYIHRIGRTGRANKSGRSITFITAREENIIRQLEKYTKSTITKGKLPEEKDIIENRIDDVLENLNSLKEKQGKYTEINDYLEGLSLEEMRNLTSKLLEQKVMRKLGSDFSVKNMEDVKKKKKKRNLDDSTRIFLTIGKLDNITKHDFLLFIEKKANIKEGTCTGVEIMSKFTFMNVKNECLDKVMKSCNNIKYKDRLIRIEKAKN